MHPSGTSGALAVPFEAGLRPLPWPPIASRSAPVQTFIRLAAAWSLSFFVALVLGFLSVKHQWYNYPVGGIRLGLYPPWTIGVLWAVWFGWGYGAAITLPCCLILALMPSQVMGQQEASPGMAFAPALLLACADAAGLWVLIRFLSGFPPDPRFRSLRDAGLLCVGTFLAAIVGANGSFVVAYQQGWLKAETFHYTLEIWEGWWLGHCIEVILVAGPLATLLGTTVEHWKTRHFECSPREGTFRRQALAAVLGGLALIVFYSILLQSAGYQTLDAINRWSLDRQTKDKLIEATRAADQLRGVVLATLLGLVAIGAWIALALRRRHGEQLRQTLRQQADERRRAQQWQTALAETAEDTQRGLEPGELGARLARRIKGLLHGARVRVRVLLADPWHEGRLQVPDADEPGQDLHRELPVDSSLPGHVLKQGASLFVAREPEKHAIAAAHLGYLGQLNAQAYLALPLPGERSVAGVLEASFEQPRSSDPALHQHLQTHARLIGLAIERGLQTGKERQHASELAALSRLAQDLAEENDSQHLLQRLLAAAVQWLGASAAAVYQPGRDAAGIEVLDCQASTGLTTGELPLEIRRLDMQGAGLVPECVRERRARSAGMPPEPGITAEITPGWTAVSAIAIPLMPGTEETCGALVVTFPAARRAGSDEASKAEELARQAAAGLRRLKLLEATRRQAAEIALFEQIGRSFAEHLSVEETLQSLVRNVGRFINTRWAGVFELDEHANELVSRAITIPHPDAQSIRIPVKAQSLVATCYRNGQTYVSSNLLDDSRSSPELNAKYMTRSGVTVPLGPAREPFGVLFATDPEPKTYSAEEVRRLEQVAALATAALERSRLHEEVRRRADELALLHEVGSVLVETPRLDDSLHRIADIVRRHYQAAGAGFLLVDAEGRHLAVHGAAGLHANALRNARVALGETGIITQAYHEQRSVVVGDKLTDPRMGTILNAQIPNARSGIVAPMRSGMRPVGIVGLFYTEARRFSEGDVRRLESVARLAAAAVEREKLGQALQASEARISEIVDSTPALVVGLDKDGNILSYNATAEAVTGYRRDEVIGRNCMELLYPDPAERERVIQLLTEFFETDGGNQGQVTTITTRDGRKRQIRWQGRPMRGHDGNSVGLVGMGIDVTDQLQLEAQFLQAQKMESVGALAGGMAHDFNNLLGGILGQAALAHAQLRPGDPVHKILRKIENAAQRGADLTSKLLAFARRSVIQPMPVDLGLLIRESAELLAGSLPRDITVISQVAPGLPAVEGDPTQLQQVLLNLCVNARDAMPNGGTLNLRAAPGEGDTVRVEVTDTGTGISDEAKAHLFEPFFTTKEKGKGTGLGLAVVFGIVRSHSGRIDIETEPGKGTSFILHFPVLHGAAPAPAGTPAPALESYAGTEALLLIDDEPIMRETTHKLLESMGYRMNVATGGEDALHMLDSGEVRPEAIVLDVMMPGLAGVPLLLELRKRLPNIPVILVSGFSKEREVQLMLQAGAHALIQKPFRLEDLAAAIRRALQKPR